MMLQWTCPCVEHSMVWILALGGIFNLLLQPLLTNWMMNFQMYATVCERCLKLLHYITHSVVLIGWRYSIRSSGSPTCDTKHALDVMVEHHGIAKVCKWRAVLSRLFISTRIFLVAHVGPKTDPLKSLTRPVGLEDTKRRRRHTKKKLEKKK